jgi:hypothetical protein
MAQTPRARRTGTKAAATEKPARLPKERAQFKQLVAVNPNYFGNLPESKLEPVKEIVGNTTYERLTCVGLNPQLNLLEGTVQIKRPSGFKGNLCSPGSTEYVRFYVDYGSGWQDAGVASFNAHDIPNIIDCAKDPDKPLTNVVTLPLDPEQDYCGHPVLPAVRGILSWELLPPAGNPNWPPVWGNVLDTHVQIRPRPWFFGDLFESLGDLIKEIELPPAFEEAFPHPIPIPDPPPFELAELVEMYSGGAKKPRAKATQAAAVEPHRFTLHHVQAALMVADTDQEAIASKISEFAELGLDWEAILKALDDTKADVNYEELECLGLDYDRERLVATFRIKLPAGYSGDLCHHGSYEYVAFWADWDDTCEWTYLGTVAVNVHDFAKLPAGGLTYSAVMPVDLNAVRRGCGAPKIGRVRAVLSWAVPPSASDPDALQHWGNRLDAHVQIKPGVPITEAEPIISIVGGIGLANIDVFVDGMTKTHDTHGDPGVPFAMYGWLYADEWAPHTRKCPFGGTVIVQGPPPPVPGYKYRLWAHNVNTGTTDVVKSKFFTTDLFGNGTWRTPDPTTGYSWYLSTLQNMDQVLAYWAPGGDDLWEIRLELATGPDGFEVVVGTTPWYLVQIDNTGPVRKGPTDPPLAGDTMNIHIDAGGDCNDFNVGTTITGRFVARDLHFGAYSLTTHPVSLSPPNPSPSSGIVQTAPALPLPGGDAWSLNTAGMQQCGYVLILQVWDRTIVGSYPGSHNYNFTDVGFCLRTP